MTKPLPLEVGDWAVVKGNGGVVSIYPNGTKVEVLEIEQTWDDEVTYYCTDDRESPIGQCFRRHHLRKLPSRPNKVRTKKESEGAK